MASDDLQAVFDAYPKGPFREILAVQMGTGARLANYAPPASSITGTASSPFPSTRRRNSARIASFT